MQDKQVADQYSGRVLTFTALIAVAALAADRAQAWTLKTLHSFCSEAQCADGDRPLAGLTLDASGNLYGTTEVGGAHNRGAVFRLQRKGEKWRFAVLYSFCEKADCTDGAIPDAHLIADANGAFYGTATTGGAFGCGTVFRLAPPTRGGKWRLTTLHDFCAQEGDGQWPGTGLAYRGKAAGTPYDGVSPLYGTTRRAGAHGGGTVYAIVPNAKGQWKETVLYSLCAESGCTDGAEPLGDLLVNGDGNLFGTASTGGIAGKGVAFQLTHAKKNWEKKTIYSFCSDDGCADGGVPVGPLVQDASGAIIGGGLEPGDEGVLYKLGPKGKRWRETALHTFCGTCEDGYDPMGGIVFDGSGNMFGTAAFGGGLNGSGSGVVFKLNGGNYKVLYTFCSLKDCADGVFPRAPITIDKAGHIYGTTSGGLAEQRGSVFELVP